MMHFVLITLAPFQIFTQNFQRIILCVNNFYVECSRYIFNNKTLYKITMKKYRYTESPCFQNNFAQQLKSFQCSSVIQQQPMCESNQMSWLAPFVNGIEKSQKERSPKKLSSKLVILDQQLYKKPKSLYDNKQDHSTDYKNSQRNELRRSFLSHQNPGIVNFSKKKRGFQLQTISNSTNLNNQQRKPLQLQSLNYIHNRKYDPLIYMNKQKVVYAREDSSYLKNASNQSIERTLNESVGKIKKNKSKHSQQKQNAQNYYDIKQKQLKYNCYATLDLQPSAQCTKKLYKNDKNYQNKRSVCFSKRQMDEEDKKLQAMEDRLNNIIQRSAGKIKSSKQARNGGVVQNKRQLENRYALKKRDPSISEFHFNKLAQFQEIYRQKDLKQRETPNFSQESSRVASFKQSKSTEISQNHSKRITQDSQMYHRKMNTSNAKQRQRQNSAYEKKNNSISKQKIIKLLPKVQDIIPQQSSDQISSTRYSSQFRKIFKILDVKDIGLLQKGNCAAEYLNQQLKYMLGSVLTKIKYQNYTYDCQKFTNQCQKIACTLDSDEIREILEKISINILKLETKRSYYDGYQANDTKRSVQNSTPKDSVVVKKYEFQRQQQNEFLNIHIQKQRAKSQSKLIRQPYLQQSSFFMPANSKISSIQMKDYQNQFNNSFPEIYAIQRKNQLKSLSKNPYIGDQNEFSQFEQVKNLRFSKIVPVKDLFQNQKRQKMQEIPKINFPKSQSRQIQRNDKILNLNKRLSEYINRIPKQSANQYQIKLDFKELTKNLKA